MNLVLNRYDHPLTNIQIDILLSVIKRIFIYNLNLNYAKIKLWNDYINSKLEQDLNIRQLLILSINNLRVVVKTNEIIIRLDYRLKCPGFNAKLYDICKLVEYGNLDMPGLYIFEHTFQHIFDNLYIYI